MLNPSLLIRIDKLLRLPYIFLLGVSGFLSSTKKSTSINYNDEVVILKMMGIGSITRIISSLKAQHVNLKKVTFITLSSNEELCKLLNIGNVVYISDYSLISVLRSLIAKGVLLRRNSPKTFINYERGSNILGLYQICFTAFSQIKTVTFHDFDKDFFTRRCSIYSIKGRPFQDLISLTYSEFQCDWEREMTVYDSIGIDCKKVIVNINASDYMPYRKFPREKFMKVIREIFKWDNSLSFDLVGSKNERSYVEQLIKDLGSHNIIINNRCGEWTLKDLMVNLAECVVFITNDSGPMHLAASIHVPMICIWGPTSSTHFGYDGRDNVINISLDKPCRPCFLYAKSKSADVCNNEIHCMTELDSQLIVKSAIKVIEESVNVRTYDTSWGLSRKYQMA